MDSIEFAMPDSVRRHLKTILDEGNSPTRKNRNPQGRVLILEVPIPGKGHEDVGNGQQGNCLHGRLSEKVNGQWSLGLLTIVPLIHWKAPQLVTDLMNQPSISQAMDQWFDEAMHRSRVSVGASRGSPYRVGSPRTLMNHAGWAIHLIAVVIYPLSTSPNLARRDLMAPLVLLNVCARPTTGEPFTKSSCNFSS